MANKYEPDFESGKIDVFQVVSPMVAFTDIGLKPFANGLKNFISSAASFGNVTKCHAPLPVYSHSGAVNVNCMDQCI